MNEHGFVKAVHKKLPTNLYRWKIHDSYTSGVPDAMYAGEKAILFAEYKYIPKLPARSTSPVKINLSGLQVLWLNNFVNLGHNVVVIVGTEDRNALILKEKEWDTPILKGEFLEKCIKIKDISDYILGVCTAQQKCIA